MAFPTAAILDALGISRTVNTLPNAGQNAKVDSLGVVIASDDDIQAKLGIVTETAPATDIASSGLNGRLQRVAQRLTSLIALIPAALGQTTKNASLAVTIASDDDIQAKLGIVTETAPATDIASSGLNGRLQRIAQRLTSLIAQLPASLGIKTAANSLSITHASDDAVVAATGAPADAAWASGSGSLVALLKAIAGAAIDTTTPSPVKIDQTTPGTTNAVSVQTPADVISFVPVLDTAVYAAGDVLFATAAIAGVTRANDGRAMLVSLTAIDKSKQKPAMTLFFYQTNVTSAAANAANNLSDADAITCLGYVRLLAADWIDLANNSFLCYSGAKAPNLLLEAASSSTTVYVVGILDAGTPTFALADLMLKLGLVQS